MKVVPARVSISREKTEAKDKSGPKLLWDPYALHRGPGALSGGH